MSDTALLWTTAYGACGLAWMLWNASSRATRTAMAAGGHPGALLFGMLLGFFLWPVWAGIGLFILVSSRKANDGGDLP